MASTSLTPIQFTQHPTMSTQTQTQGSSTTQTSSSTVPAASAATIINAFNKAFKRTPTSGGVTPLILSRLHALRLCFLLTLFVRPNRFYRLPDSLRTLPLSRYLAALVSTRLTMLTFLFRIHFSRSRCLCLLTLLS
jgi:hypothetical protein